MTNLVVKALCVILCVSIVPATALAQDTAPTLSAADPEMHLSVPLLEGMVAPFTGLLISEADATQCILDAASVSRLTIELAVRTHELDVSTTLREAFIAEQRARIDQLRERSWWDENGNIFMLGLGLILGVAASALVVGLAN